MPDNPFPTSPRVAAAEPEDILDEWMLANGRSGEEWDSYVKARNAALAAARRTAFDQAIASVRAAGMDYETDGNTIQACVARLQALSREER